VAEGQWSILTFSVPEANRQLGDKEAVWLEQMRDAGAIRSAFAWNFFTAGDSREAELSGIKGALAGSLLVVLVTLLLSLPVGVAAAIYLEEFAPKNRFTDLIEVNINNLAAVPSIIFGLLGLAVFLNAFGMPRSAPLVGGLVLALLVLPTIIIASRAAIRSVPPSIKEAALGVGASHQQAVFHHVLPLAVPGILTGTILGVARALGETAPLLMIGMVAFIVDVPGGFTDAATVLPVQIYLWSDLPEQAFQSRTAAAIILLLVVLFSLNAIAIYLRKRFERRW
jgi:phosphate transport system permease protein